MLLANQKLSDSPLLSCDEETFRTQRTWLLLNVLIITWAFFGGFYWIQGNIEATRTCVFVLLAYLTVLTFLRNSPNYELIFHSFLTTSAVGIFLVSISDPSAKQTIYFFPISILVSSYLFGVRRALVWLIISLHFFAFYHCFQYGIGEAFLSSPERTDN